MTVKRLTAFAVLLLVGASSAYAEFPFATGYSRFVGTGAEPDPNHGYIEVPDHPSLDITGPITIEGWVNFATPFTGQGCRSIVGKQWHSAFWVGVCGSTLRAYLKGAASNHDSGIVPAGVWTHFAIVFDGAFQRHYINGEQIAAFPTACPLPVNNQPLRIGSDVSFPFSPNGDIEEIRIWNVARTQVQIQATMFQWAGFIVPPGLVGAWGLNPVNQGNVTSSPTGSALNGSVHGALSFLPSLPDGPFLSTSRIPDFRFKVRITGGATIAGVQESDCVPESACISGAVPGRSEVFIRVVGPRPNGYLWPNFIKFTQSRVEVWIEQISTGGLEYYDLAAAAGPTDESLTGLFDRLGWLP